MTTTQTTRVNRGWFIKRLVLPAIVLVVLGVWGLVDATIVYPRSGRQDASLKLKNYLTAAEDARRLTQSFVKIDDPAAEIGKLAARDGAPGKEALSPMERARLDWLRSLKTAWTIDAEEHWVAAVKRPLINKAGEQVYSGVGGVSDAKHEMVPLMYRPRTGEGFLVSADGTRTPVSTDQVAKHLKDYWSTAPTPSALAFYDLPLQWIFTVVGFAGSIYLALLYVRVAARKYHFEPETHTLILPTGERIAPGDLKEVDKRKWHKFYVALNLNDGKTVQLDLYRYDPLEEWVLAMEKVAFPETAVEEGTKTDDADDGAAPDALRVPKDVGKVSSMNYGGLADGSFAVFLFDAGAMDSPAAAYAQGEVLKSLGVAIRDEGGWRQWLTATAGSVAPETKSTLMDMLTERQPTFKVDGAHLRQPVNVLGETMSGAGFRGYVVVIGRLSREVASKAHESLMDPPANGYLGMALVKHTPPTMEGIAMPLGAELGMEIKADTLVGRWDASKDDVETAGLRQTANEEAAA